MIDTPAGLCDVQRFALVESGKIDRSQKLQKLIADFCRRFVLNPVAHVVEFETSNEAGQPNTELVFVHRIELFQPIHLTHHEEGRLVDRGAF
jgi:hypothetical protein